MHKFAHIGDCHLGSFREQPLRKLGLESFEKAIDECIRQNVDFIILSGDLFDTSHPSLEIVASCVKKIREAKEKGITTYMVYGSHDYNVGSASIIDILTHTGLFVRIPELEKENNKISIKIVQDPKTGAKITGMFGMPNGREKEYYEQLDIKKLEDENGFKIFIFHSAIEDFRPPDMAEMAAVPLSLFPKNFNYYAGAHVHRRFLTDKKEYGKIVFPGILLGSSWQDLEQNTKEPNGFYIVHFDDKGIQKNDFIEIKVCDTQFLECNVNNKSSTEAREILETFIENKEVNNKVILLKISGELTSGSIVDVEIFKARRKLLDKGAIEVYINSNSLTLKEQTTLKIKIDDSMKIEQIENTVFTELLKEFKTKEKEFSGNSGVLLSEKLLRVLREPKKGGENKTDYIERMISPIKEILMGMKNEA